MNPEMDRPDSQQFEVKELTEDGESSTNLQRADHGLLGQKDHPFESIQTGVPLYGRDLPNCRNQHGMNMNDDGKVAGNKLSEALRAAYEEAKRASTQVETALEPSAATSTESSEQSVPGEPHSDETQLSFPHLLREILSNDGIGDIATWLPHGNGFLILDKKRFEREIMPIYFGKISKFSSFTRKLNRWQFTRVTRGQEIGAYYHPLFQRSKPHLSLEMSCHQSRTHQESEPMNPVVFGIATPAMIRHGFAAIPDRPHASKLNRLTPTGQDIPDINLVSTNEATTSSSSPSCARRYLPAMTKEFEALLQQVTHQQRQSTMATPAVSDSGAVISTSSSDSNISGGHHEHNLALLIQHQLGVARASTFSSSSQADTSTSSLNSIISNGYPEHHRIRILQQQLEALQRQLMDRQQTPLQSDLPLSFMSVIEQSNRAQNSTQTQHSMVAESSTSHIASGMAERNLGHYRQNPSDMMGGMETIGGGHANATHMLGTTYDVTSLRGEAGVAARGESHHLGTGATPLMNNSFFCSEGTYAWPPDIPFEVSAARHEVIGDLDPTPIATNNYHEYATWIPPQQQQSHQTRQGHRGSESAGEEELHHLTGDSHDLLKE